VTELEQQYEPRVMLGLAPETPFWETEDDRQPVLTCDERGNWILFYFDDPQSPTAGVDDWRIGRTDLDGAMISARKYLQDRAV
jgi:hypothetical protein